MVKLGFNIEDNTPMSSEESENELDSSRLENLHWCKCTHCCIMPTLIEAKCCRECENLLEDKLDFSKCITDYEEFDTLCLNEIVLNTASIQYNRRFKKNYKMVKDMNNKYVISFISYLVKIQILKNICCMYVFFLHSFFFLVWHIFYFYKQLIHFFTFINNFSNSLIIQCFL